MNWRNKRKMERREINWRMKLIIKKLEVCEKVGRDKEIENRKKRMEEYGAGEDRK